MGGVIRWFVGNSVAANLLMFSVIMLGILTTFVTRYEVIPTIEAEIITVRVPYPGAAPEEVEESICARIEDNVNGIAGVDEVTGTASENFGVVVIELMRDADRRKVLSDVKSAIDGIDSFPENAEEPVVTLVDINQSAMNVLVWGDTDDATLRRIASDVQNGLASLDNISLVELKNAPPFELSIELRQSEMLRYGLSFDDVASALRGASLDLPGGTIKTESEEILVRSKGQAYTAAEFAKLPLRRLPGGTDIRIGDVATLRDGFAETDQETRFNGKPAVMLQVFRVGDQNALAIGPEAKAYLDTVRADLPPGIELSISGDETVMLQERLTLLSKNLAQGLILVMITLTLFLRFRLALWVSVGIPIAFLGGLWLLPYFDVSINMISLFGFIIVLGIVVDDAIVVAENIHHHRQSGKSGTEAAWLGASEMSKPVTFAILTTIAAFVPMLFMPGSMGTFSRNIPLVVIGVLIFSFVESLLILPAHLKHLPEDAPDDAPKKQRGLLTIAQDGISAGLDWVVRGPYARSVEFAVRFRYLTVAFSIALLFLSIQLPALGFLKFNFFPQIEADNVSVGLTMPQGTPVAVTEARTLELERAAYALADELEEREGRPIIKDVLTSIGGQPVREKNSSAAGGMGSEYSGGYLGEVNLDLVSAELRDTTSVEIARMWEQIAGPIPGAESVIYSADLLGGDGDINLRLVGDDLGELRALADEVKAELEEVAGVTGVRDNFPAGKDELRVELLPAGEAAGLTYIDLARQVRQGFYGEEVQRIQRGRDEVKVFVRYAEAERGEVATLLDANITAPDGRVLPFSYVARAVPAEGTAPINRANRSRAIDVIADVDAKKTTPTELQALLEEGREATDDKPARPAILDGILEGHPDVSYSFEGPQKEQAEFMVQMMINGIGSLFAIFVFLSVPLRSYTKGLVIMSAIPFGLIGAFWGHILTGFDLSMFSIIGVLALTGVVVNDSLVLLDYISNMRDAGKTALESVRLGAQRRFRAILLTTLTTFAGLTPLLLEKSMQARFMIPMAVSLAFGVLFATFIILVLVPSLYMIVEDLAKGFAKLTGRTYVDARPVAAEGNAG